MTRTPLCFGTAYKGQNYAATLLSLNRRSPVDESLLRVRQVGVLEQNKNGPRPRQIDAAPQNIRLLRGEMDM